MTQLIAFNSCLPFSGQVSGNKGSTMKKGWGGVRDVLEVGPPLASSVKHCVTLGQSGCLLPSISGHHGWLISGNISSEPGRFPYPFTITHWGMGRLSPESCAPGLFQEITSLWDGQETPAPCQWLLHSPMCHTSTGSPCYLMDSAHRSPVLPHAGF